MTLELFRVELGTHRTFGKLSVNGTFVCYTLEDTVRPVKIPKETAIPAGRYRVVLNDSQRFKKRLPLLLAVPNFEGVRIHAGNTEADTEGCVLVGITRTADRIHDSRRALGLLMSHLEHATQKGEEIWITITNPNHDRGAGLAA